MPATTTVYWDWVSPSSAVSSAMLSLLTRIRRGEDMKALSSDYPELTAAQWSLVMNLQMQEIEINRLYKEIQRAETKKLVLERELASSVPC
jgi:hypothetical protein